MLFSVVVPVYNVEKYLPRCIDSLINQTFKDFEIILVDDGSKDKSGKICDEYAGVNNQIRVVHKENGGPQSARKEGLAVSKGDYIICVDSDDYVSNDYFSVAKEIIDCHHPDVICFSYNSISQDVKTFNYRQKEGLYTKKDIETFNEKYIFDDTIDWPNQGSVIVSIWTKIVKRDLFISNQIKIVDNISIGEDLLVSGLILREANSLYISCYSGYNYCLNADSITNSFKEGKIEKLVSIVEQLKYFEFREEAIKAYALFLLTSYLCDGAKNLNLLKFYKLWKDCKANYKELFAISKAADVKQANMKDKVKIFLFNKDAVLLYWIMFNIK